MTARPTLRHVHLLSTVWFIACIGYLGVAVLRDVGFRWWVIFSLSGPYVLAAFLLVSLHVFVLYRGIGEAQHTEIEHPLTTTSYYMALYVAAPLLGGLAGTLGMVGVTTSSTFLLGVTLGTLGTTFVVWVIVDPVAGVLETLLPTSRRSRTERLAQAEAQHRARQEKREHLLAEAFAREERDRQQWRRNLQAQAERLAVLLREIDRTPPALGSEAARPECEAAPLPAATPRTSLTQAEQEAVELGAQAWRLGGLACMRQLHEMTIQAVDQGRPRAEAGPCDYLSYWWDGIGAWRKPSSI